MKIGTIDHSGKGLASPGLVFFSYGFRPFFLGAALFAGLAIPAWIVMLIGGGSSAALSVARDWHVHEMVFGFLPAVITGFLLTAVPNWTDRPPIQGRALMLLFALWLLGRLVMAVPLLTPVLSALIDGSFFVVVAGLVWRELAAGGSWNQAPVAGVISLYACANIFFHLRAVSGEEIDLAVRVALALIMVLLTLIGGRLVPNFTREYLAGQKATRQPAPFSRFDGLTIVLVAMAVVAWAVEPQSITTGWFLVAAGFASLGRLSRWYGWLTWREPLVFMLHWGYGWLALAMTLLGSAILGVGLTKEDAVHALTTGAIGVMTLAVMTRASLGHTGRDRHAGPTTVCIYLLVTIAALVRVFGPSTSLPTNYVLAAAALSWSGAYLLFAAVYGPYVLRPNIAE